MTTKTLERCLLGLVLLHAPLALAADRPSSTRRIRRG